MDVVICMLRAVNVGGRAKIKMGELRTLLLTLGLHNPRTLVQSGNVVFGTQERNLSRVTHIIEDGIEREFGFRPAAILRTPAKMKAVIAGNPFAKRRGINPAKLLVTFFITEPTQEAHEQVLKMRIEPEELRFSGRELYIYYPNGVGQSKLPITTIFKILKTQGTARNWNSVTKLHDMAEAMEAEG